MNFIRTTDATGKPLPKPKSEKKAELTPLTKKQLTALNALTAKAEKEHRALPERLVAMRDGVDRMKLEKPMRDRILTGYIRNAYLNREENFNALQATAALQILNGTSRADAAGLVDSWGQEGDNANNGGEA